MSTITPLTPRQQSVYDTLLAKADDVLDYEDEEHVSHTFIESISMEDFDQYLNTSGNRKAYNEAYMANLEPFLHTALETPLEQRIMGVINYGPISYGGIPDCKFPDFILRKVGEECCNDFIQYCKGVKIEIRANTEGLVRLIITGPVSLVITLNETDSNIVAKDPNTAVNNVKRFLALSSFPIELQLAVYKTLIRSDLNLNRVITTSINGAFIPPSVFNSKDIYLETAVKAAIFVMDDEKLTELIGRLSAEFGIFSGPFSSNSGGTNDSVAPVA